MTAQTSTSKTGLFAGVLLALLLPVGAAAQPPAEQAELPPPPAPEGTIRHFEVSRATGAIKIDGTVDEAAWESATVIDLPYEWFPGNNVAPPVATEALVTFDDENLYLAFRASDPNPGAIRANLMDRDLIGNFNQDDHVGVSLDTFNDERRALQFRANPRGVQVDAVYSEIDAREDFSWDAIWASEGRITDTGYVVEIAIPFKQLRFPRTNEPQTWGIEVFRSYPRNVRHRISSKLTDRAKDCTLCQINKITGFTGIAPGRNLELTPTLTATRSDTIDSFPNGDLDSGDEEFEPGATVRWGVTPNTTLNATVNPDFSQVEADAVQLEINTRFALFFPEKRPFFLEGADLYLTPLQAVFTRSVADPDWGFKLNTKEGKNGLGVFVAQDELNNLIIPFNQFSGRAFLDEEVTTGVVRYRRDIGTRSALGVLYTGREGDEYHNRVGGLDGFFRFTPSDTMRVQYLRSDTLYPGAVANRFGQDTDAFGGQGLQAQYDHFARSWKGFVRYQDLDPEFRADSGFIPRVDVRTGEGQYERFFYGNRETWYAQQTVGFRGLYTEDHSGLLTDQVAELFYTMNGPKQSVFQGRLFRNKEFYDGVTYDLDQQRFLFQFNPTGRITLGLAGRFGDEIDLDNSRLGESMILSPGVQFRLGSGLDLQLDYLLQQLDVDGGQLFEANVYQLRAVYQFNVRTFVRAIVQYTNLDRNTGLYLVPVRPREQDLFTQLLFSYKLNPQTVLFAGYTDGRFGLQNVDLTQTDRTFFLKLGYALLY
ncbi:MAG TPA: DUF5916 domain-containing protein [Thermoanaerobaculia bacterium]|nr:DUF5916 domain-containing protein [Thermoanaerobaculia bacterium]